MNRSNTPPHSLRTWAEIRADDLLENFSSCQQLVGESCDIMAVVKADAYGHGLIPVAHTFIEAGASYLGVANCYEARVLHTAGIRHPIYILGPTFPAEHAEIVEKGWTPCLSTLEEARSFANLIRSIRPGQKQIAHLAIDSGMGRGGILPANAPDLLKQILDIPEIEIEGIGSHLPSADEDEVFTRQQIACFRDCVNELRAIDPKLRYIHIANSAGMVGYPTDSCNLVRPGLQLYGICPFPEQQGGLKPAMSLLSRISLIRDLPAGQGISYGRTTILERPSRIATVGIGYGDGYPRSLSGQGTEVFIAGHRCPLLGRVTMDQIMVDLTDHPHRDDIQVGDTVELFGKNILASEVAAWAGTITWEIFTGIMPRVERILKGL